jgi:integral membrane protein
MASNLKIVQMFKKVAIAEGISFLVLLLVAMPLKYLAGFPQGVTVVGWAHGVLFVAFLALAYETKVALNKNFLWLLKAFVASVLPFGPFLLKKDLEKNNSL